MLMRVVRESATSVGRDGYAGGGEVSRYRQRGMRDVRYEHRVMVGQDGKR